MNKISMRKDRISEYKAVIFDLDGTLYFQKPFRVRMITYLIAYLAAHPLAVKDMLIIKKYRQVREKWEENKACDSSTAWSEMSLDDRQYAYVADKMGVTPEYVKKVISFFMLETPLKLLPDYKDKTLAEVIEKLREDKITVIIYSDYPVEDKLKALNISAAACYTSSDEKINCMKPDPKGISVILKDIGLDSEEVLMIGDRYEKDGLAAQGNGVDYIIAGTKKTEREEIKKLL